MKRWLYLSHRWLGIGLCLFMVMWFISGMVMLYIGYPKLTNAERLMHLTALDASQCRIDLAHALSATGMQSEPDSIRLSNVAGTPQFIFSFGKQQTAVNAETGIKLDQLSPLTALKAAGYFFPGISGQYQEPVDEDAWTHSRALDPHRPLHRVQMDDAENTLLYLSNTTGEVVRDASRQERYWNWIGSWIHWLYPFRGGAVNAYAADITIYTSLAASILSVLGLWVGLQRWRFKGRYKRGTKTPYREKCLRWHHISGLFFGVLTLTWIVSGFFSMNPWKIFDSGIKLDNKAYQGGALNAASFKLPLPQAIQRFQAQGLQAHEIEWRLLDGKAYYIAFDTSGRSRILPASDHQSDSFERFSWETLNQAAQALMLPAKPLKQTVLSEYDFYYYSRAPHTMTGHIDKRLPIMRMEFDDPASTWLHLDPYTGEFHKLDRLKRTSRWLFTFLHSWDWLPLLNSRPLWDMWMIFFSCGGVLLSGFGVMIGLQRLRLKFKN